MKKKSYVFSFCAVRFILRTGEDAHFLPRVQRANAPIATKSTEKTFRMLWYFMVYWFFSPQHLRTVLLS
ncbi:hypothetical protein CHCC15337_4025 [Bacillus paralicheniformis]|uniref:Uncharacterized protein n=1 Tax=Bacillus paralicheniformis TaxID=1648923 RepID=A0A6N2FNR9_9BACI|nr:hypothetical protein B4121_0770 [Bacillus paralicheniformis]TWJ57781.1 hypothetical protein CHCC5022_4250 [Bacillus paralicheniformis]TWJ66114.1 hypothetical protein CHCC5021_0390 [Bacillus paralicheniformis]TWJ82240.1 hypothetical protein CHCC4186_1901 [Bacillus paralicheniformis]TWL03761.1 hypothetical protein CHCC19468_0619 [Bacillus paralicheniformis]